jgi:hypothetical protein
MLERLININSGFCKKKLCSGQGYTFVFSYIITSLSGTEEYFHEPISVMSIDLELLLW